MTMTGEYIDVGKKDEFMMRIGKVVVIKNEEIAVFHTSDGRLFALENKTPHPRGGPLAEGIVSGHYLYDPLYDWRIDLESGEVQEPDSGQVRTYPVRLEGDVVQIAV
ncbi:nitrite reductase (NADH) small subunit [Paenibacillus uliginis N3/975]|uniref:Nitrite reductase (NADH) small subunit n=1 Tax=Paenibacillus uliginis N3/975 TaxID=1313296 RepID=A0A1X7HJD1_9BACL|nr:nitrite reductase small subunit NirD [Paenibacillus uliginis]SMF87725.1 nitrite reductase (NADH) small subunit [Paenibacillus uliginis N3/975]